VVFAMEGMIKLGGVFLQSDCCNVVKVIHRNE
jgi:hypothetical protein